MKISKTRSIYFARLLGRIIVLLIALYIYFANKGSFDVVSGIRFFEKFSPLHILWAIWVFDMVIQLMPVKANISIGSQKLFPSLFKPIKEKVKHGELKKYIKQTTERAYRVMIIWVALTIILSVLHIYGVVGDAEMILIATFFYVCDLICVLIWCPFRLIVGTKCCTTCRIFNWDHLMMFLPIISVNSFYSWTLVVLSFANWLMWELCVFLRPERFWENSNMALKCSECTDKLCTQYCKKLKRSS